MIPPQPDDARSEAQRFDDLARRLLAVPKKEIDRQEKKEEKAKKHKAG
jgi:hypothetical protein